MRQQALRRGRYRASVSSVDGSYDKTLDEMIKGLNKPQNDPWERTAAILRGRRVCHTDLSGLVQQLPLPEPIENIPLAEVEERTGHGSVAQTKQPPGTPALFDQISNPSAPPRCPLKPDHLMATANWLRTRWVTDMDAIRRTGFESSSSLSKNREYIAPLDELRAFAAILIVVYHGFQLISASLIFNSGFTPDQWLSTRNPLFALILEGHTAVGLFITLSGFVLTVGVVGQTVDYRKFLVNRLLRIYPLYLVCLFLGLAMMPSAATLHNIVFAVLPLANMPNSLTNMPFTAMFWTVAVEFQIYLVFPFLLLVTKIRGTQGILELAALAILFRLMTLALGADTHYLSYWTVAGRIDQFLFGMVAAHLFVRSQQQSSPMAVVGAFAAAIAVVFMYHRMGGWPSKAWWKVLWPTIEATAWAAVIYCVAGFRLGVDSVVRRGLQTIGRTSYSVYLLHFAVVSIVIKQGWLIRPFSGASGSDYFNALLTTAVIALPVTLVLSAMTYQAIERPFLEMRWRYRADAAPQSAP